MNLDVAVEELIPHPVEAVWAQLTDAAAISGWLMKTGDFRPEVGARFRMKTRHLARDGWVRAEVTELEPPRRMVWAWRSDEAAPPTTVTFELTPEAGGTRLRLTHVGEIDPEFAAVLQPGWPEVIELLRRSLD
jgi:uncharacterized protein YndB with AHSA1/START domain